MKQVKFTVAALLIAWQLAAPAESRAQQTPPPSVANVTAIAGTPKLRLVAPAGQPVHVTVQNNYGEIFYEGNVTPSHTQGVTFNLNSLPNGQYYLTATTADWWLSQAVQMGKNGLQVAQLSRVDAPTLRQYANNKVEVALPGQNVGPVRVALYDRQNELVFSREFADAAPRRLNFNTLPSGAYTLVVGAEQKQFARQIAISH